MDKLKIATAQFKHKSADKAYNLAIIERLAEQAAAQGAEVIAFHECSITGYTFPRNLDRQQMLDIAERVPDGESTQKLVTIASKYNITILAGSFEKDENDNLHKPYI